MKIEMGESLFYSWLRHVKECQIVQTNWTTSGQWNLLHEDKLEEIKEITDKFFSEKYGYDIYKKTASLSQLLQQAESDAIGIAVQDGHNKIYAVDVAFHESGLQYGDKESTIQKIIRKCLRTAMCIYGYLNAKEGEIIFAAPKIGKSTLEGILPCIEDMQIVMYDLTFHFKFRILANDDFQDKVLDPILEVSDGIADTNELFLRGYQMIQMFEGKKHKQDKKEQAPSAKPQIITPENEDMYAELKIGKVVQKVMRPILECGTMTDEEVYMLQSKTYSKQILDLNFPLLVKADGDFDKVRYYKDPVNINGDMYMLCSQWVEGPHNNDRPYLMKWIKDHQ